MQQDTGDDPPQDDSRDVNVIVEIIEPFEARDGDTLVVSYPDVKLPLTRFSTLTVGGLIYTRKLLAGDDPQVEYDRIYAFLKRNAEKDALEKVRVWRTEVSAAEQRKASQPVPPKPDVPPTTTARANLQRALARSPATNPGMPASSAPPAAVSGGGVSNRPAKPVPPRPR